MASREAIDRAAARRRRFRRPSASQACRRVRASEQATRNPIDFRANPRGYLARDRAADVKWKLHKRSVSSTQDRQQHTRTIMTRSQHRCNARRVPVESREETTLSFQRAPRKSSVAKRCIACAVFQSVRAQAEAMRDHQRTEETIERAATCPKDMRKHRFTSETRFVGCTARGSACGCNPPMERR